MERCAIPLLLLHFPTRYGTSCRAFTNSRAHGLRHLPVTACTALFEGELATCGHRWCTVVPCKLSHVLVSLGTVLSAMCSLLDPVVYMRLQVAEFDTPANLLDLPDGRFAALVAVSYFRTLRHKASSVGSVDVFC